MSMSDPIADMLTRIRNANTAKHDTVDVPASKMKIAIADILVNEGYIAKYELSDEGVFQNMHITLKYGADKNEKIITGLKRISKPGLRIYVAKMSCREYLADLESLFFPQTRVLSPIKKLASCRLAARFWHSFGNLKRNKATENRESVRLSPKI